MKLRTIYFRSYPRRDPRIPGVLSRLRDKTMPYEIEDLYPFDEVKIICTDYVRHDNIRLLERLNFMKGER